MIEKQRDIPFSVWKITGAFLLLVFTLFWTMYLQYRFGDYITTVLLLDDVTGFILLSTVVLLISLPMGALAASYKDYRGAYRALHGSAQSLMGKRPQLDLILKSQVQIQWLNVVLAIVVAAACAVSPMIGIKIGDWLGPYIDPILPLALFMYSAVPFILGAIAGAFAASYKDFKGAYDILVANVALVPGTKLFREEGRKK